MFEIQNFVILDYYMYDMNLLLNQKIIGDDIELYFC